jgi:hypothetical protein
MLKEGKFGSMERLNSQQSATMKKKQTCLIDKELLMHQVTEEPSAEDMLQQIDQTVDQTVSVQQSKTLPKIELEDEDEDVNDTKNGMPQSNQGQA